MINRKEFKEFHTQEQFNEWILNNFGQWFQNMKANKCNNDIYKLLSDYTGSMNIVYNKLLRGNFEKDFDEELINTYLYNIEVIKKEISKFTLHESIVTYRYICKKLFFHMFDSLRAEKGKLCSDKGFLSTTLLPHYMKDFPKDHKYNCLLKLYLPKGTKGAYVGYYNESLKEYEFLLPPDTIFKYISRYFSFNYFMWVYVCELVKQ